MTNIENDRLEYKGELTNDLKLEKTAVAFLNYKGGDIYFGIADDGKIIGVSDPDNLQNCITNRLTDNIAPSVTGLLEVFTEERDGKTIIIVHLASGVDTPYYIKRFGRTSKGCYIRIGSSNRAMNMKQINHLLGQRHILPLSEIKSRDQDLTFNQLKLYYISQNLPWNDRHFAKNFGFLTEDNKYNYLAYMFADTNRVSIRVPLFAGTDKASGLIQNEDYGNQCLITAINKVLEKLEIVNATQVRIEFPKRIEQKYVDLKTLREAVINAFAHNDYSNEDTPICEIYEDKFVIVSYGNPLNTMDEEDFFTGLSKPRNPLIMRIFHDLHYVEHNGVGNPYIVKNYGRSVFGFSKSALRVTLKFDKSLENVEKNKIENNIENKNAQKTPRKCPENAQKILDAIIENPFISRQELAAKLEMTEDRVKWNLNKLKAQGAILRVGPDKGGHWEAL